MSHSPRLDTDQPEWARLGELKGAELTFAMGGVYLAKEAVAN